MKTVKQELIECGVNEEHIDTHESDLYVLRTAASEKWLQTYEWKQNVTVFVSEIDQKQWYDIPFGNMIEHYAQKKATARNIEEKNKSLEYIPAKFGIEASEGGPLFEGYHNHETWNGFACPCFDKEVALQIVAHFQRDCDKWVYEESEDVFKLYTEDDDEAEVYYGHDIEVNGQKKHVYAIGSMCWIWDAFEIKSA